MEFNNLFIAFLFKYVIYLYFQNRVRKHFATGVRNVSLDQMEDHFASVRHIANHFQNQCAQLMARLILINVNLEWFLARQGLIPGLNISANVVSSIQVT